MTVPAALLDGPITKDVVAAWKKPADASSCWYCWRPAGGRDAVTFEDRRYCSPEHAARDVEASGREWDGPGAPDALASAEEAVQAAEDRLDEARDERRAAELAVDDAERDVEAAEVRVRAARTVLATARRSAS